MRDTRIKIGGKEVSVPWNLADRLVDYLSPSAGDARYVSRVRVAIHSNGGFNAADSSRPANQHGSRSELDADSAVLPDLVSLRAASQDLFRNNCIGYGAIATNVTRVVGNGLFPKPRVDRSLLNISDEEAQRFEQAAEREYLRVTETRDFDAERHYPFSLWQSLVFASVLVDGDCLVNLPRFSRHSGDSLLKVQLIPAARISNPAYKHDTKQLVAGVSKDKFGGAKAYHVSRFHPGNRTRWQLQSRSKKEQWQSIRAYDEEGNPLALHLFDKKIPGQTRGYPYLAPVIELLRQLGRYTDAEVMAAVISGMFTVFVESQSGDIGMPYQQGSDGLSNEQVAGDLKRIDLNVGAAIGLPEGKTIRIAESKRPSQNFDPFFLAITNQIAIALELPGEVLLKRFTASYSAARGALEDAWCYFLRRRSWMVKMLCQPVYNGVLAEAVAFGRLSAPGFFRSPVIRQAWLGAQWIGDAKPQIDETKAVRAAVERIEARLSTLDEEARMLTGTSFEDKLPQIIKERQLLRESGIDPDRAISVERIVEQEE